MRMASHVNLDDTEAVRGFIALKQVADSFKRNLCDAYNHYVRVNSLSWTKPHYQKKSKLPIVPTEERLNIIIGHASRKYALILSILRDTGIRPIEVSKLTLEDVDLEKGIISIRSAKGGNPRQLKLKPSTTAIFIEYAKRYNVSMTDRLFPKSSTICNTYERLRTSVANKLKDSMIKKIRLYDYRHHYATMLYFKTRDILLVKESLGHRKIENTLIYTHLINLDNTEDYTCKTVKDIQEASSLIESGFDFVTTFDNLMLFRKRK
jgi:integrase